jgi:hypothetical protein
MWLATPFAGLGLPDFRKHFHEVLPLAENPQRASPPPRSPRAIRSYQHWSEGISSALSGLQLLTEVFASLSFLQHCSYFVRSDDGDIACYTAFESG